MKIWNKISNITILKGKKAKVGPVKTMDIKLDHIRAVFFPKSFWEKYRYLGAIPYYDDKDMLHALVLAMDGYTRPSWCPKWFLRFLHLFGSDNSVVRVRNRWLHNLQNRITKGTFMWDYKTKWSDYDLRISISGPKFLQDLADAIEEKTYRDGSREEMINQIKEIDSEINTKHMAYCELTETLRQLKNIKL